MSDLAIVARGFYNIIHEQDDASQSSDYREVVLHINALQNMVMAQAAARAYPSRYWLMGGVISASTT